ncbi:DUF6086 family protein [Streptomyces sp. NPDC056672]|uniref:DUF6086 family protein n=1 Tax=Streptomyces sp. NPDC056672 TaxID=3345906 RepID=UPI003692878E
MSGGPPHKLLSGGRRIRLLPGGPSIAVRVRAALSDRASLSPVPARERYPHEETEPRVGPLSYQFETADRTRTIWDPALNVGKLYMSLAQGVGELLRLPTGLTPNERGGCDVDMGTFQTFTQGMYDKYCSTNHFILRRLLRGLLVSSIVMLENGDGTIIRTPERETGLLEDKDDFTRSMWVED